MLNVADCLVAPHYGDADAIADHETVLIGLAAQDPQTVIVGLKTPYEVPVAAIIGKERRDLTRFIDGVIDAAIRDGTWNEIYNKYPLLTSHRPVSPPTPTYRD